MTYDDNEKPGNYKLFLKRGDCFYEAEKSGT